MPALYSPTILRRRLAVALGVTELAAERQCVGGVPVASRLMNCVCTQLSSREIWSWRCRTGDARVGGEIGLDRSVPLRTA